MRKLVALACVASVFGFLLNLGLDPREVMRLGDAWRACSGTQAQPAPTQTAEVPNG